MRLLLIPLVWLYYRPLVVAVGVTFLVIAAFGVFF